VQDSIDPGLARSRRAWLAALPLVSVVLVTGCGGGPVSPGVANGGSSARTTTAPTGSSSSDGNANQLLVGWASCMRSHGDSNQADPVVTANKVIDINWNGPGTPGGPWGTEKGGHGNTGPGQYCRTYLQDAVVALQSGRAPRHPRSAELLKYSECMRANGFPDFPDPSGNGSLSLNVGSAMSPSNPVFQKTSRLCAQKTGVQAFGSGPPPPGTIELNGGLPGGANG
jgi:hypothetical protein